MNRKMNILLHELIHGRILIYQKQYEKIKDEMEEYLANVLTRGFERLVEFSF